MAFQLLKIFAISFVLSFLLACEKEEVIDTCKDGIFTPGEVGVDCGGPCPPCEETVMELALAEINGSPTRFGNYTIEKHEDWILRFFNDTIDITLNIGNGDSLGARPIKSDFSRGRLHNKNYLLLHQGLSLFTEINATEQLLSFFLEAKLVLDPNGPNFNPLDTLFIRNGDFVAIPWSNE